MAKTKEAEEFDGLDIISVGSLHRGHWEKKYWSSSRGKDRHPYPVGYQAVRARNGSSYKAEIHEGPRGPLFTITCDGQSCSGPTPDIAWEKFQKTRCPHLKIWHGKRFSCKIDGVEFFGFKNPIVRRLLRQLMINKNATAEQSLLSSSSNICAPSDILPSASRKRSTRCEQNNSVNGTGLKRPRPDQSNDAGDSNLVQGNQMKPKHGFPTSHLASKEDNDKLQGSSAVHSEPVVEENYSSAKDGFPLKSSDFSEHQREKEANSKSVLSHCAKSTGLVNSTAKELDRSQGSELEGLSFPVTANDSLGISDVHLCAPDTLDFEDDCRNVISSARGKTSNVKEVGALNAVISDGLVNDSHQAEEIGTSNSNIVSANCDIDSVGQEMAKLMMTVLLPQAIPLLKESSSKKKRATISPSKVLCHAVNSLENNMETNYFLNLPSSAINSTQETDMDRDKGMNIQCIDHGSVVPNLEHVDSVMLDSFDNDQVMDHVAKQAATCFNTETCHFNIQKKLAYNNVKRESVSHNEINRKLDICHKEVKMGTNIKPQESDKTIFQSVSGYVSRITKIVSEDVQGVSVNLHENLEDFKNHCVEKNPKNALNGTQVLDTNDNSLRGSASPVQLSGKDYNSETRAPTPNSTYQPKNNADTRRKVPKQAYSTGEYTGPLSESVICRNSGDDYAPTKSATTGTSLVSKSRQSSDSKPCNRDIFGATTMVERQSSGLTVEKATTSSKPEMNVISPLPYNLTRKLVSASKAKDVSCLLDPFVPLEKGLQENYHKERLEDGIIAESACFTSCKNQVTSFCDENGSEAREVQGDLDVNHYRDVEVNGDLRGIVNLVGAYFHPLPISSVLLATKGNHIHICVSCGRLGDNDRTLFIYKVAIEEPRVGCPSFDGYTSARFPFSEVNLERCGIQFTTDGQFLVLLDSIKTPYCREGRIDCMCPACSSGCLKQNAVKVVQVNPGYLTLVSKLETIESLQCILVCENNYLVAAGKSGRLHIWVMNSTWSAWLKKFIIPAADCIASHIMELKRIPQCAHLVVGQNDFGEFFVWDILKRVIVSGFSACGNPIKQFLPISLLSWQPVLSNGARNGHIDEIMAATKNWFSEHKGRSYLPSKEDIAVWLLVSTISDSDAQHKHLRTHCQANPTRWWRLALLVNDRVILGSTLDPRATAICASFDRGIMGRDDGLVYMWEFSSGTRLGVLHHFKGGSVSCIATDDSRPEVVAIAADDGQLLVCLHNQQKSAIK